MDNFKFVALVSAILGAAGGAGGVSMLKESSKPVKVAVRKEPPKPVIPPSRVLSRDNILEFRVLLDGGGPFVVPLPRQRKDPL